jgi:hypothetical protein
MPPTIGSARASREDCPTRYRSACPGYLVTGERKARPVVPRQSSSWRHRCDRSGGAVRTHSFDSVGGSDIAFRNPRAETILPSGDRVMTIGANWFVNRWITVQVNAIRERIDVERSQSPAATVWSRVMRVQFVL